MTVNATHTGKAARGTKRVCQACEVRFYDLWREPIVCPSCGAQYTVAVQPASDMGRRASPAGKTGWRQSAKRPSPLPVASPALDAESPPPSDAADADADEVATEEVASASPEDDRVLEVDGDDADFTGLVEIDVEDPKES